jgi:hypothetical protein
MAETKVAAVYNRSKSRKRTMRTIHTIRTLRTLNWHWCEVSEDRFMEGTLTSLTYIETNEGVPLVMWTLIHKGINIHCCWCLFTRPTLEKLWMYYISNLDEKSQISLTKFINLIAQKLPIVCPKKYSRNYNKWTERLWVPSYTHTQK